MVNKKKLLAWLMPVLILLVGLGVHGILVKTKPEAKIESAPQRVWNVRAETVEKQPYRPDLQLYGRVESPSLVTFTAAIEADVTTVNVNAGDRVEAGDVLVELNGSEATQRLRQRQAELAEIEALIKSEKQRHANDKRALKLEKQLLALSEKALERSLKLESTNMASQTQTDEARQAVTRQRLAVTAREFSIAEHPARLNRLKARLEQAAARVSQTFVAPGTRVRMGEKLLTLFDSSRLEVRAQIPMAQMSMVRGGFERDGALPAKGFLDGTQVELVLNRFASAVDKGQGGVDAFFHVTAGEEVMQIGRVMELLLTLPPVDQAVSIPKEALYGTNRVYKIVESRLNAVEVAVVGEQRRHERENRLLVQSDQIADGDRLLVTKFANAMDGLTVAVQP